MDRFPFVRISTLVMTATCARVDPQRLPSLRNQLLTLMTTPETRSTRRPTCDIIGFEGVNGSSHFPPSSPRLTWYRAEFGFWYACELLVLDLLESFITAVDENIVFDAFVCQ